MNKHVQPRLPARKNRLIAQAIYRTLVVPPMRRTFDRVALLDGSGAEGRGLPTILYSNHVSWWDGYLAFVLEQHWRGEFYLMMEEAQLRRYRFFQRCGCFSVDRQDAREGLRSVQYAAELLGENAQRTVLIFPQGTITANDRRPLVTYPGIAHIAKRVGAVRCVPMALRLEFGLQQRATAFLRVGPAHVVDGGAPRLVQAELDARLLREVDGLRDDVVYGDPSNYLTLLRGQRSINVWWDEARMKSRF